MEIWHMNGAGNDFLVLDGRGLTADYPTLARKLCARYGADGFMAIDVSQETDFRLYFYNSDGSRGEMCGNGSRCVCRFAYEHALVGTKMCVQTDAGRIYGERLSETEYRIRLNAPSVLEKNVRENLAYVELGTPGLPHAVVEVTQAQIAQREALRPTARVLRFDPIFPKGANVNFYAWLGDEHVRMLSYERGVEDYTLACGTGTGAVAAVLRARGELPSGRLTAEHPGGRLEVTVAGEGDRVETLLLRGPTEVTQVLDISVE